MPATQIIRDIVRQSGLRIGSVNMAALERHIRSRMKALRLSSEQDFANLLTPGHPAGATECGLLARALTTHETFFMRDSGQMSLLRRSLLPAIIDARRREGSQFLKIWSCGCASGEEPSSVAIMLRALLPDIAQWHIDLRATDVSEEILQRASQATYGEWSFRGCDANFRSAYFRQDASGWQLLPDIRNMIRYERLDILHDPLPAPARGFKDFDLILCRNVFIYFTSRATEIASRKLAACLRPEGLLVTAHGELRSNRPESLKAEIHPESVVYRKTDASSRTPDEDGRRGAMTQGASGAAQRQPSPVAVNPIRTVMGTWDATGLGPAPRPAAGTTDTRAPLPDAMHDIPDNLARAWRLANNGDLDASRSACAQILLGDRLNADAHFLMAVLQLAAGQDDDSRESLRKALYLEPDMIAAHVHLERIHSSRGNIQSIERTRATIRKLLAGLPADARIPYMGDLTAGELASQLATTQATTAVKSG